MRPASCMPGDTAPHHGRDGPPPMAYSLPERGTCGMILTTLSVDPAHLEARTGWALKPEGACKGDICVPLPDGAATSPTIDARVLSERLGMPLLHDEAAGLWGLGPE